MKEVTTQLIDALNLDVIERLELPGRPELWEPLPSAFLNGPARTIGRLVAPSERLWRHQSLALNCLTEGRNVVVATGTGSGKSLIFQSFAFRRVVEDEHAKVLVFYPLKALASDQYARWVDMATRLGLEANSVARIDGDMKTVAARGEALDRARIVLMTPDVCQSWMMRTVGSGVVRRFLDRLVLTVLDEAHVYESVFGSNVAFLLRRLFAAKRRATQPNSGHRPFQVIAATATIRDPAEHLAALTGLRYDVISDCENGAPAYSREILHINGAEFGSAAEAALTDIARGIRALPTRHRFIAFLDSRQGVERSVMQLNEPGVMPYRSGYEAEDRARIELALRNGNLDGVVATSALELGIDIPDMEIGINLGVPESRKAFRQRIGRVGRSRPGVFFVVAPPSAFRRFGEDFTEYYRGSVEPSYLYLGNRFIQFAHARCLHDEMEVLGREHGGLPAGVDWPEGFAEALKVARPGAGRAREYDYIAQLGADAPHLNYPLRQVGEANFELKEGRGEAQHRIGSISTNQAIREAYPGATYLHMRGAYKVLDWSTRSVDRSIRIAPTSNPMGTRPILRKTATFSLASDGIVEGRIKRSGTGLVAEVYLQVNESVEGYTIGKSAHLYKDLRAENPNMARKQRDFRTTGVLLKIEESWFAGTHNAKTREQVSEGLCALICRDRSISPRDVDSTHTNIALLTESGPKRLTDAVVVYDAVYGGLRLTEDLFLELERYLQHLTRAAGLAGGDAIVSEDIAGRLARWAGLLTDGTADEDIAELSRRGGWLQVYKPGSVVAVLSNGNLIERTLVEPKLLDLLNTGQKTLLYTYARNGVTALVPHDQVQTTGQDWSWILWNPETSEYQDMESNAEAVA